jgi:hypothetical protein
MSEPRAKRCTRCKRALRDGERVLAVSVVIENPKRGMHTGYNGEYVHVTCPPEPMPGAKP